MDLLTTALQFAVSQIGVREEPPGSNAGYSVERYLESVGLGPGYSWCAAFLFWAYGKAAIQLATKNPLIKTGRVMEHWQKAAPARKLTASRVRKDPTLIKPGLIGILLLDAHTGAGHTFIVEKFDGTILTTIEGNSNNDGGREGIGVFRLQRRKLSDKSLLGFLDYSQVFVS